MNFMRLIHSFLMLGFLCCAHSVVAQNTKSTKKHYVTLINDSILLTGQDRLNLDTDRIKTINVLKSDAAEHYGENLGGIVNITIENSPSFNLLSTKQVNQLMGITKDQPLYLNGKKMTDKLWITYNPKTVLSTIKVGQTTFVNVELIQ